MPKHLHRMLVCNQSLPIFSPHQTLALDLCTSLKGFSLSTRRFLDVSRSHLDRSKGFRWRNSGEKVLSGGGGLNTSIDTASHGFGKKRSIVEHILLLNAKTDLSEAEEKDMLDHLYTSQYQMNGILAISLGRIADPNADNFTHAVYMRFQKKEDVAKFYVNSYYLGILKGHVIPYCYGSISVDYESEVEDDMLSIFRRGEEFHYGVECVILLSVFEAAPGHAVEDALATLQNLIVEFRSLIVQATQGSNFNLTDSEYTHAAVIRFSSLEALEIFRESSQYKDMWRFKFHPITKKAVIIYFAVDPVGTELM